MGRVLGLGGGRRCSLCIALLVLAVFLTRDEDNLQADNLLAERFTLEVAPRRRRLDLRQIAPFEWDRVAARRAGHAARGDLTPARPASGPGSTPSTAATC